MVAQGFMSLCITTGDRGKFSPISAKLIVGLSSDMNKTFDQSGPENRGLSRAELLI